jgi:hypothetical protein
MTAIRSIANDRRAHDHQFSLGSAPGAPSPYTIVAALHARPWHFSALRPTLSQLSIDREARFYLEIRIPIAENERKNGISVKMGAW